MKSISRYSLINGEGVGYRPSRTCPRAVVERTFGGHCTTRSGTMILVIVTEVSSRAEIIANDFPNLSERVLR